MTFALLSIFRGSLTFHKGLLLGEMVSEKEISGGVICSRRYGYPGVQGRGSRNGAHPHNNLSKSGRVV